MNTDLNSSCHFYLAIIDGKAAACFAVLHLPNNKVKNFKRGHRLVVLPDYQGFGLGHALSTEIARYYKKQGYRFIITSNTKSLYKQRKRDPEWRVKSFGRCNIQNNQAMRKTGSSNRITIKYEFVGR